MMLGSSSRFINYHLWVYRLYEDGFLSLSFVGEKMKKIGGLSEWYLLSERVFQWMK